MPIRVKRKPEVAFAGEIGRQAVIFDEDDVIRLLRVAVEREGSQTAFAKRHGISAHASMPFCPANGLLPSPLQPLLDFGARTPPSEHAAI